MPRSLGFAEYLLGVYCTWFNPGRLRIVFTQAIVSASAFNSRGLNKYCDGVDTEPFERVFGRYSFSDRQS